jgi:hypothetical protein
MGAWGGRGSQFNIRAWIQIHIRALEDQVGDLSDLFGVEHRIFFRREYLQCIGDDIFGSTAALALEIVKLVVDPLGVVSRKCFRPGLVELEVSNRLITHAAILAHLAPGFTLIATGPQCQAPDLGGLGGVGRLSDHGAASRHALDVL